MHVGERELILAVLLDERVVLLAEKAVELFLLAPLAVFPGSHNDRRRKITITHLRAYVIPVERIVVDNFLLDVFRKRQVGRIRVEVVFGYRRYTLYLPTWMQQRVGYCIVLHYHGLGLYAVGRRGAHGRIARGRLPRAVLPRPVALPVRHRQSVCRSDSKQPKQ